MTTYAGFNGFAQSALSGGQVQVMGGALITVFDAGTDTPRAIYTGEGTGLITQPLAAEANGQYFFFTASGRIKIKINKTGFNEVVIDNVGAVLSGSTAQVGNIQLTGNTISSTDTNGDVNITPDGTGSFKTGNLGFNTNTISSTNANGNILLSPNGTGKIGIGGTPSFLLHTITASGGHGVRYSDTTGDGAITLDLVSGRAWRWTSQSTVGGNGFVLSNESDANTHITAKTTGVTEIANLEISGNTKNTITTPGAVNREILITIAGEAMYLHASTSAGS